MHNKLKGFVSEIEKRAALLGSTKMDLAGLGILGIPAASRLAITGKNRTTGQKLTDVAEVGGLGLLSAAALKAAKHL